MCITKTQEIIAGCSLETTMVFSSATSPLPPLLPSNSLSFKSSTIFFFPKGPFRPSKNYPCILSLASSSSTPPPSPFPSDQAVLEAVVESNSLSLPAVRSYENDLTRLTIVGSVDFQQALTAAAADGGEAADEHISSGTNSMVVETIFPGPADEHSTVSTRLFLPARKVKEKAIKLKKSLTKDILSSTTSKNILAMTFRQVVLQQLWNVELEIFSPGTERDMSNLENPREVPAFLTLSSSDKRVISEIAEVICTAALENTERNFLHDSTNRVSNKSFLHWFNKPKQISSSDSSVILHNLLDHEILANAKILLENFNLERAKYKHKETKLKNGCWRLLAFSKLKKIGGPEFCNWISEWIPSYILQIDASKFSDVKFEGWTKSKATSWEVILTHSQMVSLATTLDMYYEDVFTLPSERLLCPAVAKSPNLALNKGSSLLVMCSIALASGIFLVAVSVLAKVHLPHLPSRNKYILESSPPQSIGINFVPLHSVESSKLEAYCVSIIRRIKDFFGWPGEVKMNPGSCAWIGELPTYVRKVDDIEPNVMDMSSTSTSSEASEEEMKALQDAASYQVVLSTDGSIIGFQPTSRVAVNNWAANPLAKELYRGKNLSPGFWEPGLKISHPSDVVILELLMSVNPESYFALVRPVDVSDEEVNVKTANT